MTQLEIIITVIALLGFSIIIVLLIASMFISIAQAKNRYSAWEHQFKTQCNHITRRSKPTLPPLPDESTAYLLRVMKGNDK